jgi:DNA repair protein RadC
MNQPAFVKTPEGRYTLEGETDSTGIIETAAKLLLENARIGVNVNKPQEAARLLQLKLANENREHFGVMFLDAKNRLIEFEVLFQGTIDGAAVYPRIVLQRALALNASAVIFAHNHPSDDCEPSLADRHITKTLIDALALIDVRVLDHFIVSKSGWVSMAERGLM